MRGFRYAATLILAAGAMSLVVLYVLQQLATIAPEGLPPALAAPTVAAPALNEPTRATPEPAAAEGVPDPRLTNAEPRRSAAGAATVPWTPSAAQEFGDALFTAMQRADTTRARALLAARPTALPDSATAAADLLDARLARAVGDTARARQMYDAAIERTPSGALRRERAQAARDANDLRHAADLFAALVAETPADAPLRRTYADVLLRSGAERAFAAQLDTVAQLSGAAEDFERLALAREAAGDDAGARAAFREAARRDASAARFIALGDRLRWADSLAAARAAYDAALRLDPTASAARAGNAAIARLEYVPPPTVQFAARQPDPEQGVTGILRASDDNTGWSFRALGAQLGLPIGSGGTTLLAGADLRRVGRPLRASVNGARWTAGVAQQIGRTRLALRGGQLRHDDTQALTVWGVEARVPVGRFEARAEATRDAAYETLRAGATLAPIGADTALTAQALRGTVFGELVPGLDLWAQAETVRLGDANRRSGLQVAVQQTVRRGVGIVAAGGVVGFRQTAPNYWTPSRFTLGSIGIDLRTGDPSRVALSARVLPGIGEVRGLPSGNGTGLQFAANAGALAVRGAWRTELNAAVGRDREGGYQVWSGELRITRALP